MSNYGDGSGAIVRVRWQSPDRGHVFIAEQEGQTTHFIDPQIGNRDCSDYFNPGRIKTSKTFLLRIDDKEFTDLVERCVQKVIK